MYVCTSFGLSFDSMRFSNGALYMGTMVATPTTTTTATSMAMAADGTFKSQHDYHERESSEMSLKKRHSEERARRKH